MAQLLRSKAQTPIAVLLAVVLLGISSLCCSAAQLGGRRKRNDFLTLSLEEELALFYSNSSNPAEALEVPTYWTPKIVTAGTLPRRPATIRFASDAVVEMLRLLESHTSVAANVAANATFIGGPFSLKPRYRHDGGSMAYLKQEQSMMSAVRGLMASLLEFSVKESNSNSGALVRRHEDGGMFRYQEGLFPEHILFSEKLHAKMFDGLWQAYLNSEAESDYKSFMNFVSQSLHARSLSQDIPRPVSIYTIPATTREQAEYLGLGIHYDRSVFNHTFDQISTMMRHAKAQGTEALVITVPGLVPSLKSQGYAKSDLPYIAQLKEATLRAVKRHARGFSEIVLCQFH